METKIRSIEELQSKHKMMSEILDVYQTELKIENIIKACFAENANAKDFRDLLAKEDFYFLQAKNIGIISSLDLFIRKYGIFKRYSNKEVDEFIKQINSDLEQVSLRGKELENVNKQFNVEVLKLCEIIEQEGEEQNKGYLEKLRFMYSGRFVALCDNGKNEGKFLAIQYFLKMIDDI